MEKTRKTPSARPPKKVNRALELSPQADSGPDSSPLPDAVRKMQEASDRMAKSIRESLKLFVLLCVAFLIIGLIVSVVFKDSLPRPGIEVVWMQKPLAKNAAFALQPGDVLAYEASANNTRVPITIQAARIRACPGVYMADTTDYSRFSGASSPPVGVCLGPDGNERSADGKRIGSNVSFSNLSWPYFQPWMLALERDFSWEANMSVVVQPYGTNRTQRLVWNVIANRTYRGREAYEVRVEGKESSGSPALEGWFEMTKPITYLVDREKRVALTVQEGDAKISLVEAPFLEKENKTDSN